MQKTLAQEVGLLPDLPPDCNVCGKPVCLRQQLIGMSLGYIDKSFCLACIATDTQRSREEVLETVIPYIRNRDCFNKPWNRYKNVDYCPDQQGCVPNSCFELNCQKLQST